MVKATTKKNKKPSKKLYIVKIVLLTVITVVAGSLIYSQIQLNNEKNSFMQLRSDFLSLKTEFNKIDPGWVYNESCTGKGGVYNDDEASSCVLKIINNSQDFVTNYQTKIAVYAKSLNESQQFGISVPQKSFTNIQNKYDEVIVKTEQFNKANCSLYNNYLSNNKNELKFVCIVDARQFYFQRSDR